MQRLPLRPPSCRYSFAEGVYKAVATMLNPPPYDVCQAAISGTFTQTAIPGPSGTASNSLTATLKALCNQAP